MSKKFLLGGTIIDDGSQAWAYEDTTPSQLRSVIAKLEKDEDLTVEISSPGGSVTAGLAMANLIREASKDGHATKAHVIGIAASMASVVACACDEIDLDESAFVMIHNPWTVAQGDSKDLRKEADILDQMRAAIVGFYRGKFEKTDEELIQLMDEETWFTGADVETFAFKANVIHNAEPLKAAACAREVPAFAKLPETAASLLAVGKEVTVTQSECQKRVSGMQASMQKQIDALKSEYADLQKRSIDEMAARENDFKNQLQAKDEELTKARAEVTSLVEKLGKTEGELRETASALEARDNALATLNASVLKPSNKTVMSAKSAREQMSALPLGERAAFYAAHKAEIDNN